MLICWLNLRKKARISEPDTFINEFDEFKFKTDTINSMKNPLFASAKCMMCVESNEVIARLDFVMLPSYAFGGDLRSYVDWVYVLKEHRHKGIAQFLFKEMELYLQSQGAKEYFLIAAENEEAQRFYNGIQGVEIAKQDVLTKAL